MSLGPYAALPFLYFRISKVKGCNLRHLVRFSQMSILIQHNQMSVPFQLETVRAVVKLPFTL